MRKVRSFNDFYWLSFHCGLIRIKDLSYLSIMRGSVQDGDCMMLSSGKVMVAGQ